jgi:hypothetical protein
VATAEAVAKSKAEAEAEISRSRKEQVQARQHNTKIGALHTGSKVLVREPFNNHAYEKWYEADVVRMKQGLMSVTCYFERTDQFTN